MSPIDDASAVALRQSRISTTGITLNWPYGIAVRGDRVVLIDTPDLMMVFANNMAAQVRTLGWQPLACALSPGLEYVAVSSSLGNYVELWRVQDWHLALTLAAPIGLCMAILEPMPSFEVTVFSRLPGHLTAVGLRNGDTIFHQDFSSDGVAFLQIVALEDGDSFAALCQARGSRFVIKESLQRLMSDPSALRENIEHSRKSQPQHFDAIGAAAGDLVVAYLRDRRGADGGPALLVFDPRRDEVPRCRVPYAQALQKGAALMASETTIIIAHAEHLEAVPRAAGPTIGGDSTIVPMRGYGFDTAGRRVAVIGDDGEIFTLELSAKDAAAG